MTNEIFLRLLRRVSPAPSDLSVPIPMPATDTSLPNTLIHASNENLQHRPSSALCSPRNACVSMDHASKGKLSFHNVSYVVGGQKQNVRCKNCHPPFIKPKPGKQIINDVSGIFSSGMNAIMGENSLLSPDFETT